MENTQNITNEDINNITVGEQSMLGNFIHTTFVVYKRQYLRLLANKVQIVSMLIMPLMWLAILGQAFNNLIGSGPRSPIGMDYITYMTPGILIQVTLFSALFGSISLFYDKESGFLKNYLIAPISRMGMFVGYILGLFTRILIQAFIILLLGWSMGADINYTLKNIIIMFVVVAMLTIFIYGFIITLASKAPNVEVFQAMVMPLSMPLMFLSPIMFPADVLPDYLKWVAQINPITFATDILRGTLFGEEYMSTPIFNIDLLTNNLMVYNVVVLISLSLIFLYLGSKTFLASLNQ